jgi:hypothetical protein
MDDFDGKYQSNIDFCNLRDGDKKLSDISLVLKFQMEI